MKEQPAEMVTKLISLPDIDKTRAKEIIFDLERLLRLLKGVVGVN